jgi:twitching motility protein PilT
MTLESLIAAAHEQGASDLHLEPGLPLALRIRGALRTSGEPMAARVLHDWAREVIGAEHWPRFLERRSFDLSRTLRGVRCRLNILQTSRGVGFAIRLLASFQATLDRLNLHPDLKRLVAREHGLVILTGPTGCGKSSTMAALIQEINLTDSRHIVTVESPIEYTFRPKLSFIRQREVGRDTPSFEQALLDALREDPDVLMVGELRDPETIRLTLNASETGHLVLATMHSSTCVEALQRIASAFPSEIQNGVRAQLADCLAGAVSQRLRYRQDLKMLVPECEILLPSIPVKAHIRNGDFFKIVQAMETGADQGMWTFPRYQTWMENKRSWRMAEPGEQADSEPAGAAAALPLPPLAPAPRAAPAATLPASAPGERPAGSKPGRRIEIEPVEGGLPELIKQLEQPEG